MGLGRAGNDSGGPYGSILTDSGAKRSGVEPLSADSPTAVFHRGRTSKWIPWPTDPSASETSRFHGCAARRQTRRCRGAGRGEHRPTRASSSFTICWRRRRRHAQDRYCALRHARDVGDGAPENGLGFFSAGVGDRDAGQREGTGDDRSFCRHRRGVRCRRRRRPRRCRPPSCRRHATRSPWARPQRRPSPG